MFNGLRGGGGGGGGGGGQGDSTGAKWVDGWLGAVPVKVRQTA